MLTMMSLKWILPVLFSGPLTFYFAFKMGGWSRQVFDQKCFAGKGM